MQNEQAQRSAPGDPPRPCHGCGELRRVGRYVHTTADGARVRLLCDACGLALGPRAELRPAPRRLAEAGYLPRGIRASDYLPPAPTPPAAFLRRLLAEWPLSAVGTDEEINGGDVVEWLETLRNGARAALDGAE